MEDDIALSRQRASTGITQAINGLFRARPITLPLILMAVGTVTFGIWWFISHSAGHPGHKGPFVGLWVGVYLLGFGGIMFALGLLMLPIGLVITMQRHRNKVELRCPACGLRAGTSARPFEIRQPRGVSYVMVTCPRCKWEFTVDKYAKLT